MNIILASSSPFRQSLLSRLQIPFTSISPDIDEDSWKSKVETPEWLASELAYQKAKKIFETNQDSIVIGSDQVCYFNDEHFDKSNNQEEALAQLKKLRGNTHKLYTAYCLLSPQGRIDHCDITTLSMKNLSDEELITYIKKDSPLFCAGSYKLESMGISLFDKIESDDSTAVVGLPLISLAKDLQRLGVKLF